MLKHLCRMGGDDELQQVTAHLPCQVTKEEQYKYFISEYFPIETFKYFILVEGIQDLINNAFASRQNAAKTNLFLFLENILNIEILSSAEFIVIGFDNNNDAMAMVELLQHNNVAFIYFITKAN